MPILVVGIFKIKFGGIQKMHNWMKPFIEEEMQKEAGYYAEPNQEINPYMVGAVGAGAGALGYRAYRNRK